MRFSFRVKLLSIVATSALAFCILVFVSIILTSQMVTETADIQKKYIPLLEYGPLIKIDFEKMQQGFQDSVAVQDLSALKDVLSKKEKLLSDLNLVNNVIDPNQIERIKKSINDYYIEAENISNRMIRGQTGLSFANAIKEMQEKRAELHRLIDESVTLDKSKLIYAFGSISKAHAANGRILIIVSIVCLILVTLFSLVLSRSVLRSFTNLSDGFKRFGQGEFSIPISIASHDELEDLATDANNMAKRIRGLLKELESFSYSVAHDLRAPLRGILGFSTIVLDEHKDDFSADTKEFIVRINNTAKRMGQLIDSLLNFSRLARKEIKKQDVNASEIAKNIISDLQSSNPTRKVKIEIENNITVQADPQLLQIVLVNLIGNAWKFTSKVADAKIIFGTSIQKNKKTCFVKDNGAGFDMQYANKLFGTFQRLHSNEEFEGTGIGLATVQSIIVRHGGEIWAESKPNEGATFYFSV